MMAAGFASCAAVPDDYEDELDLELLDDEDLELEDEAGIFAGARPLSDEEELDDGDEDGLNEDEDDEDDDLDEELDDDLDDELDDELGIARSVRVPRSPSRNRINSDH
jgi:DNA-directed RNA polymerase subunit delta